MKIICDLLEERRFLADLVQIAKTQAVNINIQSLGYLVHNLLGDIHALGAAKSTVRCVADCIGLADPPADPSMWDVVAIVDMSASAVPNSWC